MKGPPLAAPVRKLRTGTEPAGAAASSTPTAAAAPAKRWPGGWPRTQAWRCGRSGPGPHFHRTLAESFYILTGTIQIYDGTGWRDAEPGDFVHVPPGGLHGFRNESGAPASMLIHFSPGAPREGYFEGLALAVDAPKPGPEELARFYAEHDNTRV